MVIPGQLDPQMVQGVGSVLGGGAALIGVLFTITQRKRIGSGFMSLVHTLITSKVELQRELSSALNRISRLEEQRTDAEGRASSAEHSAENWRRSSDAIEQRFDREIGDLRNRLESIQTRNDALVDYTQRILEYSAELERRALAGGVDLTDLQRPPLPDIIADRLGIPETAR